MQKNNSKAQPKIKTNFIGVRSRVSPTRKNGPIRPDECFFIRYRVDGKLVEEQVGWASAGVTAKSAYEEICRLQKIIKKGIGPRTLKEERELNIAQEELRLKELRAEEIRAARDNISFPTIFKMYIEAGRVNKSPKVAKTQEGYAKRWLTPHLPTKPMKDITPEDLESLQVLMLEQKKSPQTAKHAIDLFRATWNWGKKRKLIQGDCPVGSMERVKVDNIKERWFTPEEIDRILVWLEVHDQATYRLVLLAAHTGARLGELAQITWDRVNLEEGVINFVHTKSNNPRSVPLSSEAKKMIHALKPGKPHEPLLLQSDGSPWYVMRNGILDTDTPLFFRKALAALKLNEGFEKLSKQRLTFHCLRHTAATTLLANGVDPRTVQELLGWSTMKMFERYAHVIPAEKKKAIDALESALQNKKGNAKIINFPDKFETVGAGK